MEGELAVGIRSVIGVDLSATILGKSCPLSPSSCRWHTNMLQFRLLGEITVVPSLKLGSCNDGSFVTTS